MQFEVWNSNWIKWEASYVENHEIYVVKPSLLSNSNGAFQFPAAKRSDYSYF